MSEEAGSLIGLSLELGGIAEQLSKEKKLKPSTPVSMGLQDLLNICVMAAQYVADHNCGDEHCLITDRGPPTILNALILIAKEMKINVVELNDHNIN